MVTFDFSSKKAIVFGCASGIGQATAVALARAKASLCLVDVDAQGLQATQAATSALTKVIAIQADIGNAQQVRDAVDRCARDLGGLDVAVNNAGVAGDFIPLAKTPDEEWDRVMGINASGTFYALRAELAFMQSQKSGAIVNVGSVLSLRGAYGLGPYAASKASITQLTRTAAIEYAKHGIRINAICPGGVDTPMLRKQFASVPNYETNLLQATPMRRLAKPDEIANAILWLASDGASFATGHCLLVDGGFSA